MAELDDFRLDRPQPPGSPTPRRPSGLALWIPVVVVALLIGLVALWYFGRREQALPAATAEPVAETTVETKPVPARLAAEPGEDIELPPLGMSDALVRTLLSRVSSHPQLAAWLSTDQLLRTIVVAVSNVADGQTPAKQLRVIRPIGDFTVRSAGGELYLDPASYRRYDSLAAAVESADARGAARFYATVKPRLDEAYAELGAPDGDFDRTVERAIVMLLRTPIVEGDVRLRPDKVSYAFADPALEGLTKAQRQFLRMGPRNMRIVKAKLRELAGHLGIPDAALPAPDAQPAR